MTLSEFSRCHTPGIFEFTPVFEAAVRECLQGNKESLSQARDMAILKTFRVQINSKTGDRMPIARRGL